jgi:hypothetical protein
MFLHSIKEWVGKRFILLIRMSENILSKFIHAKNNSAVTDAEFLKILNDALLNFGENCLVSYSKLYQENPKAFLNSFIKYDSVKMACEYAVRYCRKSGVLKELEGKKDFTEWVDKQPLEEKWKPVMSKFLLILWGVTKQGDLFDEIN